MTSFAQLVDDILLKEIKTRLDVTSLGMWRRVEKFVRDLYPPPRPTCKKWEELCEHVCYLRYCKFPAAFTRFVRTFAQAIHDDHLCTVKHYWPRYAKYVSGGKSPDPHNIANLLEYPLYIAASGGAHDSFRYMHYDLEHSSTKYRYEEQRDTRVQLIEYALSFGQVTFVMERFGLNEQEVYSTIVHDAKISADRYNTVGRRHLITDLMCRRHWDVVKHMYAIYKAAGTRDSIFEEELLRASATHGFLEALDDRKDACDIQFLHHVMANATSTWGLEWLWAHRPDLFKPVHLKKLKTSAKQALKHSRPDVLEWHVEHGFLEFNVVAPNLVDQAREKGHMRTLKWVYEKMLRETEEWDRPIWFKRKFVDLEFLKG